MITEKKDEMRATNTFLGAASILVWAVISREHDVMLLPLWKTKEFGYSNFFSDHPILENSEVCR